MNFQMLEIFFCCLQYNFIQAMSNQPGTNNFIGKLHAILQNPLYNDIIRFDCTKTKFIVSDRQGLQTHILSQYFRHKHFRSFVRMLNIYGFQRLKNQEELTFTHPMMQRGDQFQRITAPKKVKKPRSKSQSSQEEQRLRQEVLQSTEFYKSAIHGKNFILNSVKIEHDSAQVEPSKASKKSSAASKKKKEVEGPKAPPMNLLSNINYKFPCQAFLMGFNPSKSKPK